MPMQIDELITACEVEVEAAAKRRDKAHAERRLIIETAIREARADLEPEEKDRIEEVKKAEARAADDVKGAEGKLREARQIKAEEDEAAKQAREVLPTPASKRNPKPYDQIARVGQEERTYHKGVDRDGRMFLQDVARAYLRIDPAAEQRLYQHMAEERVERGEYLLRASPSANFAGLTVPQFLTDMYAPAVANLRPFADACNGHPLPPDGMTVNISRITTPTAAGLQATENVAVSTQDIDDTLLTENVQTVAGQVTLSRQAIDRGTGVESVTMDDLFRRYASALDNTLILQATTGLKAVAALQTYTDASPTTAKIYSQIIGAAATVEATLLGFAQPDIVIMHSRRWYSMLSAVGPNWPLIWTPGGGVMEQATGSSFAQNYGRGIRGVLQNGLGVVVDNNVETNLGAGTNQDQIYVAPSQECHLWEDPAAPVFIRADQPAAASLGILLVLYGYFAYSFRRYGTGAMVKIDGTGLVTPTFLGS